MLCHEYIQKDVRAHGWAETAMKKDEEIGGQNYQDILVQIQYTHEEIEQMKSGSDGGMYKRWIATWGRPTIEGQIICKVLSIQLDVIDIIQIREGNVETGKIQSLVCAHKLINAEEAIDVGNVDYAGIRIIHIVNYRSHYVPLLSARSLQLVEKEKAPLPVSPIADLSSGDFAKTISALRSSSSSSGKIAAISEVKEPKKEGVGKERVFQEVLSDEVTGRKKPRAPQQAESKEKDKIPEENEGQVSKPPSSGLS
jgi:hypothetical protein